jgi:hypothetical protein
MSTVICILFRGRSFADWFHCRIEAALREVIAGAIITIYLEPEGMAMHKGIVVM